MVKKIDYWEAKDGSKFDNEEAAKKHEIECVLKLLDSTTAETIRTYAQEIVTYLVDGGYVACNCGGNDPSLSCRDCRD